jgi:hypothetical protein
MDNLHPIQEIINVDDVDTDDISSDENQESGGSGHSKRRVIKSVLTNPQWYELRDKLLSISSRNHSKAESMAECLGLFPDVSTSGESKGQINIVGLDRRLIIEKAHRGSFLWHDVLLNIIKGADSIEEAIYLIFTYARDVDRVTAIDLAASNIALKERQTKIKAAKEEYSSLVKRIDEARAREESINKLITNSQRLLDTM